MNRKALILTCGLVCACGAGATPEGLKRLPDGGEVVDPPDDAGADAGDDADAGDVQVTLRDGGVAEVPACDGDPLPDGGSCGQANCNVGPLPGPGYAIDALPCCPGYGWVDVGGPGACMPGGTCAPIGQPLTFQGELCCTGGLDFIDGGCASPGSFCRGSGCGDGG